MIFKHHIIARNTSFLLFADIASKILQTLLSIVIARKLGSSDLGLLRYALSFTMLFSFIPNFGSRLFINREVSKFPEQAGIYFSNLAVIKLILSLVSLVIILGSTYFMRQDHTVLLIIAIAALVMLLDSFIQFFTGFYRGFQKTEYEGFLLVTLKLLVALSGITVVCLGYGVLALLSIRVLVMFSLFITGLVIIFKKFIHPPYTIDLDRCLKLTRSAIPFAIMNILVVFNAHIGIVLLTNIKSTAVTGLYVAALNLCGIFQFIPASIGGAILPAMTRYAKASEINRLSDTLTRSIKYILLVMMPVVGGTVLLAGPIIDLIYGPDFSASVSTLKILIWMILLSFPNTIFNVALSSIDREMKFVRIQIAGAVINVLFSLLLIPRFAHNGLAISVVVAQIIVFGMALYYLSIYFSSVKICHIAWKPSVATLGMLLSIFFIRQVNLFIIVGWGMLVYVLLLIVLQAFDKWEREFIKNGFKEFYRTLNQCRLFLYKTGRRLK